MTQFKKSPIRLELLFLDFDIDDLKGPKLPTNGDMLRYYFNRRHALPSAESNRSIARTAASKCIKIWNNKGIPTTSENNVIKHLLKILLEFNRMKSSYKKASKALQQKKINVWRQKCELIFLIASRDAHNNCSVTNRELLLTAKKESKQLSRAVNNNNTLEKKETKEANKPATVEDASFDNNNLTDEKERGKKEVNLNPKASVYLSTKNSNDLTSLSTHTLKKSDEKSLRKAEDNAKPKAFKPLNSDQMANSPNQNLREQLKQQGWIYVKKNSTWKLAVAAPPFKSLD